MLESVVMSKTIAILTSGLSTQITKVFSGKEFVTQRFSIGRSFAVLEKQVSDLHSLSRLL